MKYFEYNIIADAVDYLVAYYDKLPDIAHLAERAGYDETRFQKMFTDYVGVNSGRLVHYMNMRHVQDLTGSAKMTAADEAAQAGITDARRIYDSSVICENVTMGAMKTRGQSVTVTYGFYATPLGRILVGMTLRGVCFLGFVTDYDATIPVLRMKEYLPAASFVHNDEVIAERAAHIMRIWAGRGDRRDKLGLDLYGTDMQIQVWQALLKIPLGVTRTYQQIGAEIGKPKAARAIGNAVGANPVSLLIPCHRVIRATGIIDNYGWGSPRKKMILGIEAEHILHSI